MGSYDSAPPTVHFVIPLDRDFMIHLLFESANNGGENWAALTAREQARFLGSLKLSGPASDCR